MRALTELQVGYLAAMFDGEGNFTIGRAKRPGGRFYAYSCIAGVGNTKLALLVHLKRATGLGTINPRSDGGPTRARSWYWQLSVTEQKLLIPIILPHLVIKQRQAELMLEFFTTVPANRGPSYRLSEEQVILRAVIFDELAELNKRGPNIA